MCTECKQIVGTVDMVLKQQATQDEILAAMKSACSLLPSSVSGVCTMVVTSYGKQAIKMLVDYLADPAQLCGTIGLCSSENKAFSMPKFTPSNDMCTECKQIVGTIDMVLKLKTTQKEILDAMESGCGVLPPSMSGVCIQAVTAYGQQAINMLVNYLADPSQLCGTVGLCSSENMASSKPKLTPPSSPVAKDADLCKKCVDTVAELKEIIKNTTDDEVIIADMEKTCQALSGSIMRWMCVHYIKIYGHKIVEMIRKDKSSPKQLCQLLHACSASYKSKAPSPIKIDLYYEGLCPGCREFISDQLWPTWNKLGAEDNEIMEVGLFPYGNAHEKKRPQNAKMGIHMSTWSSGMRSKLDRNVCIAQPAPPHAIHALHTLR
jgi:hypothetical protein